MLLHANNIARFHSIDTCKNENVKRQKQRILVTTGWSGGRHTEGRAAGPKAGEDL
jgi:hypothetical protein